MKKMKNLILKFYIVTLFLCSTTLMFAQPGSTGDGTGGVEGTDPPAPIDGYIWVLAAVGLVFVFMKFKAIQKSRIQG
jgi:hypothetical protein